MCSICSSNKSVLHALEFLQFISYLVIFSNIKVELKLSALVIESTFPKFIKVTQL
jgi:hypothetical protein